MSQSQKEPTHKIIYNLMGFPVETTVEGKADTLKALLKRILEIGGTPAAVPATTSSPEKPNTPKCVQHKSPMKRGRKGWYCPRRNENTGEFCEETA